MEHSGEKKYSAKEAIPKIEYFCDYRERCQKEVRDKLFSYGLRSTEVEEILAELVKKKIVNEERFAKAFAGGKFRQNKWGRKKIIIELKARNISAYCIQKALLEIEQDDYTGTIEKSAEKYAATLKGLSQFAAKQKTLKYLMNKGFEYDECQNIVDRVFKSGSK